MSVTLELTNLKDKIDFAKESVKNESEPFKTEAFKIILTKLIDGGSSRKRATGKRKTRRKKIQTKRKEGGSANWYQLGSTTEKILKLVKSGFFEQNRTINDIIEKLKSYDYHFKQSDLTPSLRIIVRHGELNKTKDLPDRKKSMRWTYVKLKE